MEIYRSLFFWTRLVEFLISASCFILKTKFEEDVYEAINRGYTPRSMSVIFDIISVATVGYTFIILATLILGYILHGTSIDKNFMPLFLTIGGFITYLIAGVFILNGAVLRAGNGGITALGVLCVLDANVFLFDAVMATYCRCILR